MKHILILCIPLLLYGLSCKKDNDTQPENDIPVDITAKAAISSVSVSGQEEQYTFSVGISSPEKGCDQYADWWEVISETGELLYRRILAHSHVNEQPFVRSGGPVAIKENNIVYIRAHMNTSGYGSVVFKGSIASGFVKDTLDSNFASTLQTQQPLPEKCAF